MTFPEMMFYAESEGLLPNRMGKINAAIEAAKRDPRPKITLNEFKEILANYGISYDSLTNHERKYIYTRI